MLVKSLKIESNELELWGGTKEHKIKFIHNEFLAVLECLPLENIISMTIDIRVEK